MISTPPNEVLAAVPPYYSTLNYQTLPPGQIRRHGGDGFGCHQPLFFHLTDGTDHWWFRHNERECKEKCSGFASCSWKKGFY
jgi:hypothetical protein